MTKAKPRCTSTTTKGKACEAPPLKGTERCSAHPLDPGSARFGSPEQASHAGRLGGRPPMPRAPALQRQLLEENAMAVVRPYWLILGFDVEIVDGHPQLAKLAGGGAKVHATYEGSVFVSEHDDLAAMMNAAERMLDRVHGKPKQQTEITGAEGGPVQTEHVIDWSKLSVKERKAMVGLWRKAQG